MSWILLRCQISMAKKQIIQTQAPIHIFLKWFIFGTMHRGSWTEKLVLLDLFVSQKLKTINKMKQNIICTNENQWWNEISFLQCIVMSITWRTCKNYVRKYATSVLSRLSNISSFSTAAKFPDANANVMSSVCFEINNFFVHRSVFTQTYIDINPSNKKEDTSTK